MMKLHYLFLALAATAALTAGAAGPARLSYGFEAGAGVQIPTGGAADLLKTTVSFGAGIEAGYGDWRLKAAFTYGQPTIKPANPYGIYDSDGRDLQLNKSRHLSNFSLNIMAGYRIKLGDRVALTPLAGVHYSRLSWTVNEIEWSRNSEGRDVFAVVNAYDTSLGSWSWRVAADVDIKLHSRFVEKRRYTSSLRISPFVAGLRFRGALPSARKGCCIGLTFAYSGLFTNL